MGGTILLPGVGFVEMALACRPNQISALTAVTFLRPCPLPDGISARCAIRCTRHGVDSVEISSQLMASLQESSFKTCFLGNIANVDGGFEIEPTRVAKHVYVSNIPQVEARQYAAQAIHRGAGYVRMGPITRMCASVQGAARRHLSVVARYLDVERLFCYLK